MWHILTLLPVVKEYSPWFLCYECPKRWNLWFSSEELIWKMFPGWRCRGSSGSSLVGGNWGRGGQIRLQRQRPSTRRRRAHGGDERLIGKKVPPSRFFFKNQFELLYALRFCSVVSHCIGKNQMNENHSDATFLLLPLIEEELLRRALHPNPIRNQ